MKWTQTSSGYIREEFGDVMELLCFVELQIKDPGQKNFSRINNPDNQENEIWDGSLLTGGTRVFAVSVPPFLANVSVAFVPFIILF